MRGEGLEGTQRGRGKENSRTGEQEKEQGLRDLRFTIYDFALAGILGFYRAILCSSRYGLLLCRVYIFLALLG